MADYKLRDLRVRLLELALKEGVMVDAITSAKRYEAYVTGAAVASPRDVIDAALDKSGIK